MKYSEKNPPLVCMMTQSTCYKGTGRMKVRGVLWHSTGCNNPSLKRYVQPDDNAQNRDQLIQLIGKNKSGNDWNHQKVQAGLNAWIGKLADGTVAAVQTMPWDYKPWGCGGGKNGSCNAGWIQFEICEDALVDPVYFSKVYQEACELTAYLCRMFHIDPNATVNFGGKKVPTILCHADSYALGLGSAHADVLHWFPKFGKNMNTVRADVAALMSDSFMIKGLDYTPVFDPVYYADKYNDLKEVFGYNSQALFDHFTTYGMSEHRQGNAEFDPVRYRQVETDVADAYGDDWPGYYYHYVTTGKQEIAEGRRAPF
jgi:hypothetical protein